jgi:hypothetical protein
MIPASRRRGNSCHPLVRSDVNSSGIDKLEVGDLKILTGQLRLLAGTSLYRIQARHLPDMPEAFPNVRWRAKIGLRWGQVCG